MRKIYFSTYIAGAGEIVSRFLKEDIPDVDVLRSWDGLIEYQANADPKHLKYINNSYLELATFECRTFADFVQKTVAYFAKHGGETWEKLTTIANKKLSYRLMFYDQNQPAAIDKNQLALIEQHLSKGELVDRTHPALEVSAIYRSDGIGLLGIRLTYHPDYKTVLSPGELRPEVAEILVRLSSPQAGEIFLDPFSGFGAIVAACDRYPYQKIFCSDIDDEKTKLLKKRFGSKPKIIIKKRNAMHLDWIEGESVDVIVTDPPWGNFDKSIMLEQLYPAMLAEFDRVLKKDGQMIILTSRKGLGEIGLRTDVLISGRQASIYKLGKSG